MQEVIDTIKDIWEAGRGDFYGGVLSALFLGSLGWLIFRIWRNRSPDEMARAILTNATRIYQRSIITGITLQEQIQGFRNTIDLLDTLIRRFPETDIALQLQQGAPLIGIPLASLRANLVSAEREYLKQQSVRQKKERDDAALNVLRQHARSALKAPSVVGIVDVAEAALHELKGREPETKQDNGFGFDQGDIRETQRSIIRALYHGGIYHRAIAKVDEYGIAGNVTYLAKARLLQQEGKLSDAIEMIAMNVTTGFNGEEELGKLTVKAASAGDFMLALHAIELARIHYPSSMEQFVRLASDAERYADILSALEHVESSETRVNLIYQAIVLAHEKINNGIELSSSIATYIQMLTEHLKKLKTWIDQDVDPDKISEQVAVAHTLYRGFRALQATSEAHECLERAIKLLPSVRYAGRRVRAILDHAELVCEFGTIEDALPLVERAEEEVRAVIRSGETPVFGTGEWPLMQALVRLGLADRAVQFCYLAEYDRNTKSAFEPLAWYLAEAMAWKQLSAVLPNVEEPWARATLAIQGLANVANGGSPVELALTRIAEDAIRRLDMNMVGEHRSVGSLKNLVTATAALRLKLSAAQIREQILEKLAHMETFADFGRYFPELYRLATSRK